jgi:hypothetical protein
MPSSDSDAPGSTSTTGVKKDVKWIIRELDRLEKITTSLGGCQREKEFEAMQDSIASSRTFFRNTIAVGALASVIAIGGWLWGLFGIVTHNEKLDTAVTTIAAGLNENTKNDNKFREKAHDAQLENIEKVNGRISQSEFRIMAAMSQMSQQVQAPSAKEYKESRRKHIRRALKNGSFKAPGEARINKLLEEEMVSLEEGIGQFDVED